MGFLSHLFGGSQDGSEKYIYIRGMMCQNCADHVAKALKSVPGVTKADVSLIHKRATIRVSDDVTDDTLFKTIVNAGYGVDKITTQKEE